MLHTTKGIVIHQFKFKEKSVIAKIYTEKFGMQSYIINGVRSKKSANKYAYLQPLSLVEINAYHKENRGLQQLKSIKLDVPLNEIPFDVIKGSIAFFVAEIIHKSIKEEEPNISLFSFLHQSILALDLANKNFSNFHIYFLVLFTKHLGFSPELPQNLSTKELYFDLQEGAFTPIKPIHPVFLEKEFGATVSYILAHGYKGMDELSINNQQRSVLLNGMIDYFNIHSENFDFLKTKEVFEELFI